MASALEQAACQPGLPDDAGKSSYSKFLVIRHGNRRRGVRRAFLHYTVTATPTNLYETFGLENPADFLTRQDAELTQP
jgi:hypothetical protein